MKTATLVLAICLSLLVTAAPINGNDAEGAGDLRDLTEEAGNPRDAFEAQQNEHQGLFQRSIADLVSCSAH